jgi:hypothetical protein
MADLRKTLPQAREWDRGEANAALVSMSTEPAPQICTE